MNDQFLEQQIHVKYCVKLGNNASNTHETVSKAMKKSGVFEWNKQFKEGHGK
jgi:hypothetical protein